MTQGGVGCAKRAYRRDRRNRESKTYHGGAETRRRTERVQAKLKAPTFVSERRGHK